MTYYHSNYGVARKKKKSFTRFIILGIFLILIIGSSLFYLFYQAVYKINVWTPNGDEVSIYIPTGSSFKDVQQVLYEKGLIIHRNNFIWWAEKKNYPELIKPGRYKIQDKMNNDEIVGLLRSGNQTPVKVIFNNIRDIYQLSGKVSEQIEADSISIVKAILNVSRMKSYDLNNETISTIFIPDTYEFYWNTTAEGFTDRMYEEYLLFWNTERKAKLAELGMSIPEIVTLASIVERETNKSDEKQMIAGVYINRLEKGWRLQADPTLIYALNDYSIKRVLNIHLDYDSPYNTYKYGGIPPGPICIPSISSIYAVLNYTNDGYLYFCARDDLSGYHAFAKTNTQHNRNARKYQKALDKMRIYK